MSTQFVTDLRAWVAERDDRTANANLAVNSALAAMGTAYDEWSIDESVAANRARTAEYRKIAGGGVPHTT